jgi:hypothetical protein
MPAVPPTLPTDPEDVSWALQTATTLWARGDLADALLWLRRAAQAAGDADNDARALQLSKCAAELKDFIDSGASEAPRGAGNANRFPMPPRAPEVETTLVSARPTTRAAITTARSNPPVRSNPPARSNSPVRSNPPAGSVRPLQASHSVAPEVLSVAPDMISLMPDNPDTSASAAPPALTFVVPKAAALPTNTGGHVPRPGPPPVPKAPAKPPPPPKLPLSGSHATAQLPERAAAGGVAVSHASTRPPRMSELAATSVPPALSLPPTSAPPALAVAVTAPPPRVNPFAQPRSLPIPERPSQPFHASPLGDLPLPAQLSPARAGVASVASAFDASGESLASALGFDASPAPSARHYVASEPPLTALAESDDRSAESIVPLPAATTAANSLVLALRALPAFATLEATTLIAFADQAQLLTLDIDDEVPPAALVVLVEGQVSVGAAMMDVEAASLASGECLRLRGTLESKVALRLAASMEGTNIAFWTEDQLRPLADQHPDLEAELRAGADRVQALCGASIGALGERLDADLLEQVFRVLTLRRLGPGEAFIDAAKPHPGIVVIGAGELDLEGGVADGSSLGSGEFLFPDQVMSGGKTPSAAVAGAKGALLLVGSRAASQELLVTCAPLLEIFAGM